MQKHDRAKLVWQKYAFLKSQSKVIRTGFGLTGIYPYDAENPVELSRSESDLEHVMGTVILASLISAYYPETIPAAELSDAILLLSHHELGEIGIGDLPDDGSHDQNAKDAAELGAMRAYCDDLPSDLGWKLLVNFMEFQTKTSSRGQVCYCIDKLEAVLQGLLYETEGRVGDLAKKRTTGEISERDKAYIQRTGTTRLVDCWGAHFLDVTAGLCGSTVCAEILRAGVETVRGKWFDWL